MKQNETPDTDAMQYELEIWFKGSEYNRITKPYKDALRKLLEGYGATDIVTSRENMGQSWNANFESVIDAYSAAQQAYLYHDQQIGNDAFATWLDGHRLRDTTWKALAIVRPDWSVYKSSGGAMTLEEYLLDCLKDNGLQHGIERTYFEEGLVMP